jgi:hypothetical protein
MDLEESRVMGREIFPVRAISPRLWTWATGDAEGLERLLMRVQEVAWRFSTSVCGDADDAEDAMQEALIKTCRYVGRIREPAAFKPWLYLMVRNACLMGRRKRGRADAVAIAGRHRPGPFPSTVTGGVLVSPTPSGRHGILDVGETRWRHAA